LPMRTGAFVGGCVQLGAAGVHDEGEFRRRKDQGAREAWSRGSPGRA
jgi:hypothetical protein